MPEVSLRSVVLTARLAVHRSDADLVAICGTEPVSECGRSDSQLPLLKLQHLLCLSSLLTLVHPHVRDGRGRVGLLPDQQDFGICGSCEGKRNQAGEVVQRSEGGGTSRATKAPEE